MLKGPTGPVIAIDLGGTNIRVAVFLAGRIVHRSHRATPAQDGPIAVAAVIAEAVLDAIAGVDRDLLADAPVGIAAPGPLNGARGIVNSPPNLLGWVDVPLAAMLAARLNREIYLIKDANAAAVAEHRIGAGRGTHTMLYITISTGIGGGVILDDRLFEGPDGTAGEVGHVTVDMDGPLCNCGNIGCVEAVASGTAIARSAALLVGQGRLPEFADTALPGAAEVVDAAQRGNPEALQLIERAGRALGLAFCGLAHLFNPEALVIGGGMAHSGEVLFKPLRQTLERHAMLVPRRRVRLLSAELGDDVGLWGAALHALERDEASRG